MKILKLLLSEKNWKLVESRHCRYVINENTIFHPRKLTKKTNKYLADLNNFLFALYLIFSSCNTSLRKLKTDRIWSIQVLLILLV